MDIIKHSGTPHEGSIPHSGRYEWGSGEHGYQRANGSMLTTYNMLKKQGTSEKDIAKFFGYVNKDGSGNTKELRAMKRLEVEAERAAQRAKAISLMDAHTKNGKVNVSAIGREMGLNESTVRNLLNETVNYNKTQMTRTMEILKNQLDEKPYLDMGRGSEAMLNLKNKNILDDALIGLVKTEGYHIYNIPIKQQGTNNFTTLRTLAPPEATYDEVYKNRQNIRPIQERVLDVDNNVTSLNIEGYSTINKDRIMIRYAEQGGKDKDGLIELRQGVPDISLKDAHYAQVRIAADVDGDGKEDHYMKGMAVYNESPDTDMPKGVDIIYNSNKSVGTPMEKVLKPMKHVIDPKTGKATDEIDKANPFGASIKSGKDLKMTQRYYTDPKTGEKKLSAINIVNEEGDWSEWSKTLSSQFLAKQTTQLAKRQLDLALAEKKDEFAKIKSLDNATVKRELLLEFAGNCDSAAKHLKAAALPGQAMHAILPLTKGIKENEIYAPNYDNGTKVVLIRYPHAGRFEIPELTVNNNSRIARSIIGPHSSDAVGIHASVAERLSGADFDGDSVMVIPTRRPNGKIISDIKTQDPLPGLKTFDPHKQYEGYEGMKVISGDQKQKEMGKVSNLITDMTLIGAPPQDLEKAVKHSMVIIDAEKHELNYQQSYKDNDIAALKKKYQNNGDGKHGASTLISRAKSRDDMPLVKPWFASSRTIDPETGEKIYMRNYKDEHYIDKNGKEKTRTTQTTKMESHKDARELMSGPDHRGTDMERIYASYANSLKKMANDARKQYLREAENELYKDSAAAKLYKEEVDSLQRKVTQARANQPLERQAQNMAGVEVKNRMHDNPNADKDLIKKWKNQALAGARARYGAQKTPFVFTDREWEAVQAGAVGKTLLKEIIGYCDKDELKDRAMPKTSKGLSASEKSRIKLLSNSNYTQLQIAQILGISPSTVSKVLNNTYKP